MPIQIQPLNHKAPEAFARTMGTEALVAHFRARFHIPKQSNGEDVFILQEICSDFYRNRHDFDGWV